MNHRKTERSNAERTISAEGDRDGTARSPETNGVKYDYYLSNAPYGTTMAEFARVILGSHRVEDCFRRAKDECGMAEYEVQSWPGWHHHMALSLLAAFFLTKETFCASDKKRIGATNGSPGITGNNDWTLFIFFAECQYVRKKSPSLTVPMCGLLMGEQLRRYATRSCPDWTVEQKSCRRELAYFYHYKARGLLSPRRMNRRI